MKIGNLEGSPQEIRDLIVNNDLNIEDYLQQPQSPLKLVWIIVPVCLVIVQLLWLTLFTPTSIELQTFVFLIGCGAGIWLAVSVQIRFQSTSATTFLVVGVVLIMLVAIGTLSPAELVQQLKEIQN